MLCTCAKFYFLNKNIYLCSKTTDEMLRHKYSRLDNLNLLRQRHIRLQLFKYDVICLREYNSFKICLYLDNITDIPMQTTESDK